MIYPQLVGEPNFVLIGVSAVFGLLIIIIVYYIVTTKNNNYKIRNINNQQTPKNRLSSNSALSNSALSNSSTSNGSEPNLTIATPITTTIVPTFPKQTVSNPKIRQVFNIKENIYTLDDAPAVCGAVGSDIATMDQLIDAHKKGADWCNVGWTKDGLAAYPIQYSTWKTLQDNEPGKRNICGGPGINLSRNDPNLLYGVNCYGIKPEPKGGEIVKQVITSDRQNALNIKIAEFQKNLNAINLAPFNVDKWSE